MPTWTIVGNWTCINSRKTKQRTFSVSVYMAPLVAFNTPHIPHLKNKEYWWNWANKASCLLVQCCPTFEWLKGPPTTWTKHLLCCPSCTTWAPSLWQATPCRSLVCTDNMMWPPPQTSQALWPEASLASWGALLLSTPRGGDRQWELEVGRAWGFWRQQQDKQSGEQYLDQEPGGHDLTPQELHVALSPPVRQSCSST